MDSDSQEGLEELSARQLGLDDGDDPDYIPPKKVKKIPIARPRRLKAIPNRSYNKDVEIRDWLQPIPGNDQKFRCIPCGTVVMGKKTEIERHSRRDKHIKNVSKYAAENGIVTEVTAETSNAITNIPATNNISIINETVVEERNVTAHTTAVIVEEAVDTEESPKFKDRKPCRWRTKFKDEWLKEEQFKHWLEKVPGDHFVCRCAACDTLVTSGKSFITQHAKGLNHKKNVSKLSVPQSADDHESIIVNEVIDKKTRTKLKETEIKLATFAAQSELKGEDIGHLVLLLRDILSDSKLARNLTVQSSYYSQILEIVVAKVEIKKIVDSLKKVEFSVLIYELFDANVDKWLCILVHYLHPRSKKLRTEFLELIHLDPKSYSAESIYSTFRECFSAKGIPLTNIIGIACDGSNALIGTNNSFIEHLRKEIPKLIVLQCHSNSRTLIASKASEKLPLGPEDLLNDISSYKTANTKQCRKLCEIQEFFEEEKRSLLKSNNARWLASRACINMVLENWEFLLSFFVAAVNSDKLKTAENILFHLNNVSTKAYLLFLKYVLKYMELLGNLFLSNDIVNSTFSENANKLFTLICQNFMIPSVLNTPNLVDVGLSEYMLPFESVYLGPECELVLKELPKRSIVEFKSSCVEYYVALAREMQKRLPLSEPLFSELKFLKPEAAFKIETRGPASKLTNLSSQFDEYVDVNALSCEWRSLPHFFNEKYREDLTNMDLDTMWQDISHAKNCTGIPEFLNLCKVAKLCLVFPFSNGEAGGIVASANNVILENSTKLSKEALNALVIVHSNIAKGVVYKVGAHHLELLI